MSDGAVRAGAIGLLLLFAAAGVTIPRRSPPPPAPPRILDSGSSLEEWTVAEEAERFRYALDWVRSRHGADDPARARELGRFLEGRAGRIAGQPGGESLLRTTPLGPLSEAGARLLWPVAATE